MSNGTDNFPKMPAYPKRAAKADPAQEAETHSEYASGRLAGRTEALEEAARVIDAQAGNPATNYTLLAHFVRSMKAAPAQPAVDLVAEIRDLAFPPPRFDGSYLFDDMVALNDAAANLVAAHLKEKP